MTGEKGASKDTPLRSRWFINRLKEKRIFCINDVVGATPCGRPFTNIDI
jgi:hypothetical protein